MGCRAVWEDTSMEKLVKRGPKIGWASAVSAGSAVLYIL